MHQKPLVHSKCSLNAHYYNYLVIGEEGLLWSLEYFEKDQNSFMFELSPQ